MGMYGTSFFEDLCDLYVVHEWDGKAFGAWSNHAMAWHKYSLAESFVLSFIKEYDLDGRCSIEKQTDDVTVIQLADSCFFVITRVNVVDIVKNGS